MSLRYFACLLALLCSVPSYADTFSFGVVPQTSASNLAKVWVPFLEQLGKQTGHHFEFKTGKDIPAFEQQLAAGQYDLAYMNPWHFVVFHEKAGYEPLVTHKDQPLKGILVTAKTSGIHDLQQLNGTTVAFPASGSFAATMVPRAFLKKAGIVITPQFVASHESVYLNVEKGFFKAGGGVMRTMDAMPASDREQLDILWTSPGYTPHAVAASPKVSAATREALALALEQFVASPEGAALLSDLQIPKGFKRARSDDWDDIRALNIQSLKD